MPGGGSHVLSLRPCCEKGDDIVGRIEVRTTAKRAPEVGSMVELSIKVTKSAKELKADADAEAKAHAERLAPPAPEPTPAAAGGSGTGSQ